MTLFRKHTFPLPNAGFALLITMVVVSVVLAVGISLMNITVQQINLSITGRDSEIAIHAAQAGRECIDMLLLDPASDFFQRSEHVSGNIAGTYDCIGREVELGSGMPAPYSLNSSDVYEYRLVSAGSPGVTWNNGDQDVCTQTDLYVIFAPSGTDLAVTFSAQGLQSYICPAGEVCPVYFSRGFNRACDDLNSLRTVQREITVAG